MGRNQHDTEMPDPTQNVQDDTLVLLPFKMQGPYGPRIEKSHKIRRINIFMPETSVPYISPRALHMDLGTKNLYAQEIQQQHANRHWKILQERLVAALNSSHIFAGLASFIFQNG